MPSMLNKHSTGGADVALLDEKKPSYLAIPQENVITFVQFAHVYR